MSLPVFMSSADLQWDTAASFLGYSGVYAGYTQEVIFHSSYGWVFTSSEHHVQFGVSRLKISWRGSSLSSRTMRSLKIWPVRKKWGWVSLEKEKSLKGGQPWWYFFSMSGINIKNACGQLLSVFWGAGLISSKKVWDCGGWVVCLGWVFSVRILNENSGRG